MGSNDVEQYIKKLKIVTNGISMHNNPAAGEYTLYDFIINKIISIFGNEKMDELETKFKFFQRPHQPVNSSKNIDKAERPLNFFKNIFSRTNKEQTQYNIRQTGGKNRKNRKSRRTHKKRKNN
jgi:hypothetical protein